MDGSGGKAGGLEHRRSRRTSTRLALIPNDTSYQSNTGLVIPDDDNDDDYDHNNYNVDGGNAATVAALQDVVVVASDTFPGVASPPSSHPSVRSFVRSSRLSSRPSSTVKPPDPLVLNSGSGDLLRAGPRNHPSHSLPQARFLPGAPTAAPAHNYRLFQNTVPVEADDAQSQHTNGSDLISSLSHTEDLPPYTRYPEETYAKDVAAPNAHPVVSHLSTASVATAATAATAATVATTAGAIVMADADAELGHNGRLSPASRLSTRSLAADDASDHEINTAARTVAEKTTANSKWQKRSTRRAWGVVPYWAICLVATALLVIGIVLGAVMGTVLGRHSNKGTDNEKEDDSPSSKLQPIAGSDVAPLSSPPGGLPGLDVGLYSLSPLMVEDQSKSCFNDDDQDEAWSCNVPVSMYHVNIDKLAGASEVENYNVSLTAPSGNSDWLTEYPWGSAPPTVPNATTMLLVNDPTQPSQRAAWWARLTYDKTVIVAQDKFPNPSTTTRKRRARGFNKEVMHGGGFYANSYNGEGADDGTATKTDYQPGPAEGDTPWICTWPGTVLEVYIYPEMSNNGRTDPMPDTSVSSSSLPWPSSTPSAAPNFSPTTPSSIPTSFPPAAAVWQRDVEASPQRPPGYPKAWKLKERRVSQLGSTAASCRQVRITDGGRSAIPVNDAEGRPIEMEIDEDWDDDLQSMSSSERRWVSAKGMSTRDAPEEELTDCGCLWWVR